MGLKLIMDDLDEGPFGEAEKIGEAGRDKGEVRM